ncbi:MAG: hypothetical protein IKJ59_03495 [Clostridia bacterium]|nr:hypothetical protein [Clostridia bacterium]
MDIDKLQLLNLVDIDSDDSFVGKSVLKSNLFAWKNATVLNYSLEKMQKSHNFARLSV